MPDWRAIWKGAATWSIGVVVALGLGSEPVTGSELITSPREAATLQSHESSREGLPARREEDLIGTLEEELARRAEREETLGEIERSLRESSRSEEEDEEGSQEIEFSDNEPPWTEEPPWVIRDMFRWVRWNP